MMALNGQRREHPMEALGHLARQILESCAACPNRLQRIDGTRHNLAVVLLIKDHIAGQQNPQPQVMLQRGVSKFRIARPEDAIAPEVDTQLRFEGFFEVDLRDDAEAFVL